VLLGVPAGLFLFHQNLKYQKRKKQDNTQVVNGAIRPDKHDGGNRLKDGFRPAETC
jgi:hypothetical protein